MFQASSKPVHGHSETALSVTKEGLSLSCVHRHHAVAFQQGRLYPISQRWQGLKKGKKMLVEMFCYVLETIFGSSWLPLQVTKE